MNETKAMMGLWKFSDKVPIKELWDLAQKWQEEDKHYLQLYIRKVSKDQYGIGFTYTIPAEADSKTFHDEYFDRMTDVLKRSYGNDLVGWDIASNVWIIKDKNLED